MHIYYVVKYFTFVQKTTIIVGNYMSTEKYVFPTPKYIYTINCIKLYACAQKTHNNKIGNRS